MSAMERRRRKEKKKKIQKKATVGNSRPERADRTVVFVVFVWMDEWKTVISYSEHKISITHLLVTCFGIFMRIAVSGIALYLPF